MFEISPISPELYRAQTRRSAFVCIAIFVVLGMLCATASTTLFGGPAGENFKWNLLGVLAGMALTIAVVRQLLWDKPFMSAAVYGWTLKRHLMQITNVMHHVKAGVAAGDVASMKALRFYHLGLTQMLQLDGNTSELSHQVREIDAHREQMELRGLDPEQQRFDPAWLEAVKAYKA